MGDEVLCIGLFGVFSITFGDSVIADDAWRLRKAKTLIKLLALAPERRLHVEEAAELLWAGRDPDSARNNLAVSSRAELAAQAARREPAFPATPSRRISSRPRRWRSWTASG